MIHVLIKLIDADIYMYLNNNNIDRTQLQSSNDEDDDDEVRLKHELKRKELIENCKHIRSIFETQFHPRIDDVVDAISYLDMNGANNSRIKCLISDTTDENGKLNDFVCLCLCILAI
jgi:hypothetical protein